MIRQLIRGIKGLALSVLVIYLTSRILVLHHGEVPTFQARVEALTLGISMAMLATWMSSIIHLKLKRKLETTRIEERLIGFTSFESEVDEYVGEAAVLIDIVFSLNYIAVFVIMEGLVYLFPVGRTDIK